MDKYKKYNYKYISEREYILLPDYPENYNEIIKSNDENKFFDENNSSFTNHLKDNLIKQSLYDIINYKNIINNHGFLNTSMLCYRNVGLSLIKYNSNLIKLLYEKEMTENKLNIINTLLFPSYNNLKYFYLSIIDIINKNKIDFIISNESDDEDIKTQKTAENKKKITEDIYNIGQLYKKIENCNYKTASEYDQFLFDILLPVINFSYKISDNNYNFFNIIYSNTYKLIYKNNIEEKSDSTHIELIKHNKYLNVYYSNYIENNKLDFNKILFTYNIDYQHLIKYNDNINNNHKLVINKYDEIMTVNIADTINKYIDELLNIENIKYINDVKTILYDNSQYEILNYYKYYNNTIRDEIYIILNEDNKSYNYYSTISNYNNITINNILYNLKFFIYYDGGHFISYIKDNDNNWYSINDANRAEIIENDKIDEYMLRARLLYYKKISTEGENATEGENVTEANVNNILQKIMTQKDFELDDKLKSNKEYVKIYNYAKKIYNEDYDYKTIFNTENELIDNIMVHVKKYITEHKKIFEIETKLRNKIQRTGGYYYKINFNEILKYYYNELDKPVEINSIFKLYFIIGIYIYYKKEIFDYKKNLREIYDETKKIYKKYINEFNKNRNCFIKNYYINKIEIEKYLNLNFIYPIYEKIELEDINIKIKINNSKIKINKTSQELKEELDEFIRKKDYILFNENIIISENSSYKQDISYLINFIRYYSYNKSIIIDNFNDLLSLIVVEFITNTDEIINLKINDKDYSIPNIKIHPYRISDKNKPIITITLNKIEEELFIKLLSKQNYDGLYAIMARYFYYLDFDLTKPLIYNFYINNEIEEIITDDKYVEDRRLLININNYHFIPLEKITNLKITKNKYIFLSYYGILLISTLYTSISLYNYLSLLYIYIGLEKYKEKITNIKIIELIKSVIIIYRYKLKTADKLEIDNLILKLVNFRENPIINKLKLHINIDINMISKLLKNNSIKEINYNDLYDIFKEVYYNYILENSDELIIKLLYSFILPILKEIIINTDINTITLQKEVIRINAIETLQKYKQIEYKGGTTNTDINITNDSEKTTNSEVDTKKSTDTTPQIQKLIKDLSIIGTIELLFKSLNIEKLEEVYFTKLNELSFLPRINTEDPTKKDNFLFDTESILGDFKIDFNDRNFLNNLNKISTLIDKNLTTVNDEIKLYDVNSDNNKSGSSEQQILTTIKNNIKILKTTIESLNEYKEINNGDVKQILKDFKIIIDEKEYINLVGDPKTIIDDFEEYVLEIENLIDIYRNILKDIKNTYDSIKKGIDDTKKTFNANYRNDDIDGRYRRKMDYYDDDRDRRDRRDRRDDKEPKDDEEKKGGGTKIKDFKERIDKITGNKENIMPVNIKKLNDKIDNVTQKNNFNKINDKINEIKNHYKKLKTSNLVSDSVDKEEVLKNFIDNDGINLFEKMLYQYDTDVKESTDEIAKNNFYDNVQNNDLDPEKELAINIYDKLIFVVVIIILRLFTLQLVYYFIDRDIVLNIKKAIYYYAISYVILLFIMVFVVNIDVFRFRIVFNYLNMHINSTNIFGHVIIKLIITYLIYLLILNVRTEPVRTKLSNNEKIKLKYKLDILTITIAVFLVILTLVL